YEAELAAKKKNVEEFIASADEAVRQTASAGATLPEKRETLYTKETKSELKKMRDEVTKFEKEPPDLPSAMGITEDTIADVAIHIRGNPQKLGAVTPRHVPP